MIFISLFSVSTWHKPKLFCKNRNLVHDHLTLMPAILSLLPHFGYFFSNGVKSIRSLAVKYYFPFPFFFLLAALSQTPRTPEYRTSRTKQSRTISFKEYIEAELNSKPVFTTNQGKSKDPGFENGIKEVKSSSASTEGARTTSSPRYSFTSKCPYSFIKLNRI